MKTASLSQVRATILNDPELREEFYQDECRRQGERIAADAVRASAQEEQQRRALNRVRRREVDRLLKLSPAEAWMALHPEVIDAETAPTVGALRELVMNERRRFKAARLRLSEMGVR